MKKNINSYLLGLVFTLFLCIDMANGSSICTFNNVKSINDKGDADGKPFLYPDLRFYEVNKVGDMLKITTEFQEINLKVGFKIEGKDVLAEYWLDPGQSVDYEIITMNSTGSDTVQYDSKKDPKVYAHVNTITTPQTFMGTISASGSPETLSDVKWSDGWRIEKEKLIKDQWKLYGVFRSSTKVTEMVNVSGVGTCQEYGRSEVLPSKVCPFFEDTYYCLTVDKK